MFNGLPEHFHHFIASRASSLPIPLSFPPPPQPPSPPPPPLAFASFDHYPSHQTLQTTEHNHQNLHQLQHQELSTSKNKKKEEENERSIADQQNHPWSNDEVLTLLRIRSSMESWFPDFTWEHVSRKLAEVGFKRSGEKCKEKFEEESRNFNNLSYNKSYRFFTELDEIYHGDNDQDLEKENEEKEDEEVKKPEKIKKNKRKRKYKFEMLKGFCEAIVSKTMAQQEELYNKLIEDMAKRDEEMIAREDAWRIQEMERLNKEIEIMSKEQEIANDKQAMLIDFLKKFVTSNPFSSSSSQDHRQEFAKKIQELLNNLRNRENLHQNKVSFTQHNQEIVSDIHHHQENPNSISTRKNNKQNQNSPSSSSSRENPNHHLQNPAYIPNFQNETSSSTLSLPTRNPNSTEMHEITPLPNTPSSSYKASTIHHQREDKDVGKRWPRDEVLALINLRCSFTNGNNINKNGGDENNNKELINSKGPLWERISQGMQQMGYERSAKRCKEKWENINKYFRKTKDNNNNKKRSLDARTCPYFHQLSSLYNQGILVAPTDVAENHRVVSENASLASEHVANGGEIHVDEDGKSIG